MAEEEKGRQVKLRLEPPEKGREPFYANFLQVNHTPWDFTFHFGNFFLPPEVPEEPGVLELEVKAVARITIPPRLIKGIIKAIQVNIETYESSFGVLPDSSPEEE